MIRLDPMTEDEFRVFQDRDITSYASENVKAGYWTEQEALEKARQQYAKLLPNGVQTEGHHLFTIVETAAETKIGVLWLQVRKEGARSSGFIYSIELDENQRGKGYGRQAMLALEQKARDLGLKAIGLHVFAHNTTAHHLYEKMGYQTKSMNMIKELE